MTNGDLVFILLCFDHFHQLNVFAEFADLEVGEVDPVHVCVFPAQEVYNTAGRGGREGF